MRVKTVMSKARNAAGAVPRQGFAAQHRAVLIATRREQTENQAIRCCAPSQGSSLGVVVRLDWPGFQCGSRE